VSPSLCYSNRKWASAPSAPDSFPREPAAAYTGLALTIAGVLLARIRPLVSRRNWSAIVSIKEDHQLVRSGPYAFVRHPIYSGLLLGILGTAVAFGEWRLPRRAAPRDSGIPAESPARRAISFQQFGSEYERYRTSVKALIPFVPVKA